jgi:hypothetical protein
MFKLYKLVLFQKWEERLYYRVVSCEAKVRNKGT